MRPFDADKKGKGELVTRFSALSKISCIFHPLEAQSSQGVSSKSPFAFFRHFLAAVDGLVWKCHGEKKVRFAVLTVVRSRFQQGHLPFAPCVPKWSGRIMQTHRMAAFAARGAKGAV